MPRALARASPLGRAAAAEDPPRRRPGATARSPALIGGAARSPRPPASPPPPPPPPPRLGSASWPAGSRLRRRHSLLRRRSGPSQRPPRRSRVAVRAAARGPAMSGSAAAAVAVAAAAAASAAAAAHFQPRSSSPRPGPAELGPPRRPRPPPPPPPPRPEPITAGRLSPPGHGPLRSGAQGVGACGRAPGAGTGSAGEAGRGGAGCAGRGEGQSGARGPAEREEPCPPQLCPARETPGALLLRRAERLTKRFRTRWAAPSCGVGRAGPREESALPGRKLRLTGGSDLPKVTKPARVVSWLRTRATLELARAVSRGGWEEEAESPAPESGVVGRRGLGPAPWHTHQGS
jgi:hypothetical protein